MAEDLVHKKCIPCEKGNIQPYTFKQAQNMLTHVKGWTLRTDTESSSLEIVKITKDLHFKDFRSALMFVNELGDLAEFEGHHPDISIHSWNKVRITFYTHSIKGLCENDFIMAAKVNQLIADSE